MSIPDILQYLNVLKLSTSIRFHIYIIFSSAQLSLSPQVVSDQCDVHLCVAGGRRSVQCIVLCCAAL